MSLGTPFDGKRFSAYAVGHGRRNVSHHEVMDPGYLDRGLNSYSTRRAGGRKSAVTCAAAVMTGHDGPRNATTLPAAIDTTVPYSIGSRRTTERMTFITARIEIDTCFRGRDMSDVVSGAPYPLGSTVASLSEGISRDECSPIRPAAAISDSALVVDADPG